jgi:di/tricarboxylate transporter
MPDSILHNSEAIILILVLFGMVCLFITEWVSIDIAALLGLAILTFCGLIPYDNALSGFSSPAVLTMTFTFILAGALQTTGVGEVMGGYVFRFAGRSEVRNLIATMLMVCFFSAFMNNIVATALLMPAVSSIAFRSTVPQARLLMPLAFGASLGGMLTLIGTPPNMIAADLLRQRGLTPFHFTDFTLLGFAMVVLGIGFMAILGRRALPHRDVGRAALRSSDLFSLYRLHERLFSIVVPKGSKLHGRTLAESKLGSTLGVQVLAIDRFGKRKIFPSPSDLIFEGDTLLCGGKIHDLEEIHRFRGIQFEPIKSGEVEGDSKEVTGAIALLGRSFVGKTLRDLQFRSEFGVAVVGIERTGNLISSNLGYRRFEEGDQLLILGSSSATDRFLEHENVSLIKRDIPLSEFLQHGFFIVKVPEDCGLIGLSVAATRLGELAGITVAGVIRDGRVDLAVNNGEALKAGDRLLAAGNPERVTLLNDFSQFVLSTEAGESELESPEIGVVEVVLSPRSDLIGKTLEQIRFRESYDFQVLAIWRDRRPHRSRLGNRILRYGDALLLQGPRSKISLLKADQDFVVLSNVPSVPERLGKAPYALFGLVLMVMLAALGIAPAPIAALAAAAVVVLSGAITMEEAYRQIEWKTIFLVAALMPVGFAFEKTGLAAYVASWVTNSVDGLGPHFIIAGLAILSSLLSQLLDSSPAVVLAGPIALRVASETHISPYPLMMAVALAASIAFITPFSAKANLLVMGAGGYRSKDYFWPGLGLTIIGLVVIVFMVPMIFPF